MNLGELEKLLLNYLWSSGPSDAKRVFEFFKASRGGSLSTIQSTLERLYKKNLLTRNKLGHAFVYAPAMDKKAFIGTVIKAATQDFAPDNEQLTAAFLSMSSQLDEDQINRLTALIHQARSDRTESPDGHS